MTQLPFPIRVLLSTQVAPFDGMTSSALGREGSKFGIENRHENNLLEVGGLGA